LMYEINNFNKCRFFAELELRPRFDKQRAGINFCLDNKIFDIASQAGYKQTGVGTARPAHRGRPSRRDSLTGRKDSQFLSAKNL
jgi:hypothetical protein